MAISDQESTTDAPPTVAGSHMSLLRPATPRIPGEAGSGKLGEVTWQPIIDDSISG